MTNFLYFCEYLAFLSLLEYILTLLFEKLPTYLKRKKKLLTAFKGLTLDQAHAKASELSMVAYWYRSDGNLRSLTAPVGKNPNRVGFETEKGIVSNIRLG